jgi:4'-phosphopantetheinyl transferase
MGREHIQGLYPLLSTTECMRAEGFLKEQDRDYYILNYGVLRLLLSYHAHCNPQEIQIRRNKYGKPYVNHFRLHFNISHTNNLLVIAIANQPVGVDIEYLDATFDFQQLIERVLSTSERQKLEHTHANRKLDLFFKYWTSKEALLKFLGVGLSLDPTKLEIRQRGDRFFSTRFPQISLQPLQMIDGNFVGFLAHTQQNLYVVCRDIFTMNVLQTHIARDRE